MKCNGIPSQPQQWNEVSTLLYKPKNGQSFTQFKELSNLEELVAHHLDMNLIESLPSKLKRLTLIAPQGDLKAFLQKLSDACPNLQSMTIKQTQIESFESLPLLANLESLVLTQAHVQKIGTELASWSKLSSLNLANNNLEDLPVELAQLKQLRRLVLDNNQLKILPSAVFAMHNLVHLGLDNNPFGQAERKRITETFGITPG